MSTPRRPDHFDRPVTSAAVARRDRGRRGLRRATVLTLAGAALVTVIGTSLASQVPIHAKGHRSSGTVASSAAAIAAAQQAEANQASASSAPAPTASQSVPVAAAGGS